MGQTMREDPTTGRLRLFSDQNPDPEPASPNPDRIVEGNPVASVRSFFESADERISIGSWTCEPGRWRVQYDETEYCRILEGTGEVIAHDGQVLAIEPGSEFVIPSGFRGEWRVITTITKRYVILL
jgi:uncharacterized protein